MTSPEVAVSLDWDKITAALFARTTADFESHITQAEAELEKVFPQATFTIRSAANLYNDEKTYNNLFNNEAPSDFRQWCSQHGYTAADLKNAVGEIQFVALAASVTAIYGERIQHNKGWSVRVLGFPSLRLAALGLASSFSGSQAQAALAAMSGRLREAALELLTRSPDTKALLAERPSAKSDDFDGRGLMSTAPITKIGDLDIASYDGGAGAKLRMVRNTTVKKDLATFFALRGLNEVQLRTDGTAELQALAVIARELGTP